MGVEVYKDDELLNTLASPKQEPIVKKFPYVEILCNEAYYYFFFNSTYGYSVPEPIFGRVEKWGFPDRTIKYVFVAQAPDGSYRQGIDNLVNSKAIVWDPFGKMVSTMCRPAYEDPEACDVYGLWSTENDINAAKKRYRETYFDDRITRERAKLEKLERFYDQLF